MFGISDNTKLATGFDIQRLSVIWAAPFSRKRRRWSDIRLSEEKIAHFLLGREVAYFTQVVRITVLLTDTNHWIFKSSELLSTSFYIKGPVFINVSFFSCTKSSSHNKFDPATHKSKCFKSYFNDSTPAWRRKNHWHEEIGVESDCFPQPRLLCLKDGNRRATILMRTEWRPSSFLCKWQIPFYKNVACCLKALRTLA